MQAAEFKAVPFDEEWITGEKCDIHAIYRRPVRGEDGEHVHTDGVAVWDLTGPLPVRRHLDWLRKGFEYVTLATSTDLFNKHVVASLRARGLNPGTFVMIRNRTVGVSPWNPLLYLRDHGHAARESADQLAALVARVGSDAVEQVLRVTKGPHFALPAHLRGIPAPASAGD